MKLIDGKAFADEILGELFERGQASGIWEDELEIGAITYKDIEFANGYNYALEDIYDRLNKAPTIEAITIEFIEEQIAKCTDISNADKLDVLYAGNLIYLLKLWERENGKEETIIEKSI